LFSLLFIAAQSLPPGLISPSLDHFATPRKPVCGRRCAERVLHFAAIARQNAKD
jgi:hypothetical protein